MSGFVHTTNLGLSVLFGVTLRVVLVVGAGLAIAVLPGLSLHLINGHAYREKTEGAHFIALALSILVLVACLYGLGLQGTP